MKQKLQFRGIFICFIFFLNFVSAQSVFINEIHYDNDGGDTGEAIELAGPAGTDLSGWIIEFYNGNDSQTYGNIALEGIIPGLQGGYGTVEFSGGSIQNGSPDGVALVDNEGNVVQFLSYEGTITALNGAASGLTSEDIGVEETGSTPVGFSLQLGGEGRDYTAFTWQDPLENTFGAINTNQDFGGEVIDPDPEPEPEPEPEPSPAEGVVFINELHYDNAGSDSGEGVELAGIAGTNLDGYSILLYNGSSSQLNSYETITLSGTFSNQQNGFGTLDFAIEGIQNGSPDGLALINPEGDVIQFLSYEGTFTPVEGPAVGIESTDIGVEESGSTPVGYSLQLSGEGSYYSDFTWAPEAASTFGEVNTGQTFISPDPVLFINELHYDNASSDTNEGVEIAGTAGTDLEGFSIILYNGSSSQLNDYHTEALSGIIPNLDNGFGTLDFLIEGLQNGSPDGLALVDAEGNVLQFLSYEGTFTPVEGPAAGMESIDIGVEETGSTPAGYSLQLEGTGTNYDDFSWQEALASTFGEINTNQSFGSGPVEPEPEPEITEPIPIAEARAISLGTRVIVEGTLSVSDQLGNTAYIQDDTAGIAIFGDLVTEEGLYEIGDSLKVTGVRAVYNELIQISDVESVEYLGVSENPIEPVSITLAELDDHRGELVQISDMIFPEPGQLFFGNANYQVSDESGTGELRIDGDVEDLVGKTQPETCAEVIGVVGRYNDITQLLPRNEEDLPCAEEFNPTYPGSDISRDLTFDAVTWNIEWFGDEANSPAASSENSDEVQKEAVKEILLGLDADVIAVQEISDEVLFDEMISEMSGYDYILSDATSYPDSPGGQKVGFVYKTETVSVNSTRAMFKSLHPFYDGSDSGLLTDYPADVDRFYASGRLPFLMNAEVSINGTTSNINFIALHARANSSAGPLNRYEMRKYDVEVLKDSLDSNYANEQVMILGDYNDDVDETVADISTTVSSYVEYVNDAEDYTVLTAVLSEQGYRSYAFNNDVIDHITVTDELDGNYIEGSARVHYEFYNSDYTYTASDHFPVSVRLQLEALSVSVEGQGNICNGAETGTLTANIEGGVAPYTFNWSNGENTKTITGLGAGTYSVEVEDALGNTATAEFTVEEYDVIIVEMPENQTYYLGYDDEPVKLDPEKITGGSGNYNYLWSTGETTRTIEVSPAETTTYTLEVTDENGCSTQGSVIVDVENISCGNKLRQDKVQICYRGRSLCLPRVAVPTFLRKGATLGNCNEEPIVIQEVKAFPNPTRGPVNLEIISAGKEKVSVEVYSLIGRRILKDDIKLSEGKNNHHINLGREFRGIYILIIRGSGFKTDPVKIIKY
ncbi:DUF5689 domain-containing protein [Autumnicola musiva]|uniref:T9SS type A sorting domain-containing protein n=1 Tax=Autumnicola musiva TaxID=3075589 RepID=A0ABU3D7I6_9FLAO|nr:DUF5689 domain-containing protein [Zunongwangia sp. F117]MDT0677497.1 T9SS type A sorting domain-containing protein [Zunongwangia sp. F117]